MPIYVTQREDGNYAGRGAFEILFGCSVAGTIYVHVITGGYSLALIIAQIAPIFVVACALTRRHMRIFSRNSAASVMIVCIVMLGNLVFNHRNYEEYSTTQWSAFMHVVGVSGMLFALLWATANLSIARVLEYIGWSIIPLLIVVIFHVLFAGSALDSRAKPFELHPNWWGEVGFAAIIGGLATRNRFGGLLQVITALTLVYLVQARGAALAGVTSLVVYVALTANFQFTRQRLVVFWAMGMFAGVAILYTSDVVWNILEKNVLLLDDPNRGLGTGLTGRLSGWAHGLEVFRDNPIWGAGIDVLASVHNGFIRVLAEGGLLLFGLVCCLIFSALARSIRRGNALATSVIVGYCVYALTYPRMLNVNPVALIFYVSLFPWLLCKQPNCARYE